MEVVGRVDGGGNETLPVNATEMTNEGPYPSLSPEVRVSLAMAFGKPFVQHFITPPLGTIYK